MYVWMYVRIYVCILGIVYMYLGLYCIWVCMHTQYLCMYVSRSVGIVCMYGSLYVLYLGMYVLYLGLYVLYLCIYVLYPRYVCMHVHIYTFKPLIHQVSPPPPVSARSGYPWTWGCTWWQTVWTGGTGTSRSRTHRRWPGGGSTRERISDRHGDIPSPTLPQTILWCSPYRHHFYLINNIYSPVLVCVCVHRHSDSTHVGTYTK